MVNLTQRGRAGLQFLGSLQHFSSGAVRQEARQDFAADPEGAALLAQTRPNIPWQERIAKALTVAERSFNYRQERLYQRYVAKENYARAIPAIEERRKEITAEKKAPLQNVGSLELDPSVPIPDWYEGVEWHCLPGGWDGYDLNGPVIMDAIGKYVFSRGGYAAVEVDENIREQRRKVLEQLPKKHYGRIYDAGSGPGTTMFVARSLFPDAELIACDLSPQLLKNGHDAARRAGIPIHFKQRDVRDTREPDNSVDAVIMYALMHEMPASVGVDAIKEAYRILKPGGDILINDPPPFSAVDAFQAVILDWDTENRGEPFFTETCATEWNDVLRDTGFVDVQSYGLGAQGYPYINRATKPT